MKTIETKRLILRPIKAGDEQQIYKFCSTEHIYKTLLTMPHPYTKQHAMDKVKSSLEHIKLGDKFPFAITLKDNDDLIGIIDLRPNYELKFAEIGYWLGYEYWGQGIMTEAARAVMKFAFDDLSMHKLIIKAYTTTPASARVAVKCGFKLEGCQKEIYYLRGEYMSNELYGITEQEYRNLKE